MNFESVFRILLKNFKIHHIRCALIGGFALQAAGYTRSTQDIDFLVSKEDKDKIKKILFSFGYELVNESEDILNFVGKMRELGKVDFLLAHRQYAKKMLERAEECDILERKFRVKSVTPEDLIGLKVQASVNDPTRYNQDMADIETLLRICREQLNMDRINEYFKLFEKEDDLKKLLKKIEHAKS